MTEGPPLAVLQDGEDARRSRSHSVDHFGGYAVEILAHAGVPYRTIDRAELTAGNLPPLVLLPYRLRLSADEADALELFVRGGGALISCGGVEGGDSLFGVRTSRRQLAEGLLSWPDGGLGLDGGRLPVWGGQLATPIEAADEPATPLGELRTATGEVGVGAALRPLGGGVACFLAADIVGSVVRMQQGVPVLGDGLGAPDGSAPIEDRLLKCDDGAVIPWELREEGPEGPAYLTPFADLLRELLLASLAECAERVGAIMAAAWYWPDALPAVATLSYDTDSNEDPDGRRFLSVVSELDVHGSWCVMYPGGYARSTYDAIREYGDEIALHYDGLTSDLGGAPHCGWSQADFDHQLSWLRRETGQREIVSQKNHVTRWEGWLELFRWVERAGIKVDQTKGPSKIGNLGFTFGTCHPWRPLEDALNGNRLMDVLEVCFHTHDMHHSQRRVELRRRLLDTAVRHAGVAHFIFHPQRIHEPGQPAALADIVRYAREAGVEWWTTERLWRWETSRRSAAVDVGRNEDGEVRVRVSRAPAGLTLLLFGLGEGAVASTGPAPEPVLVLNRPAQRLILPAGDSDFALVPAGNAQGV